MNTAPTSTAAMDYARYLRDLHELDLRGRQDSDDADHVRDQMDEPWEAMSKCECERMRGLSEDLYAIAKGGPAQVMMNDHDARGWKNDLLAQRDRYQKGDIDSWLAFLRKPRPSNSQAPLSTADIYFLQAQAWEKLGDYDTAALFMKQAEKTRTDLSGLVMRLLHLAENRAEERRYANRLLNDPHTEPVYVYMAAAYLSGQVTRLHSQVESLCHRLILPLKRALERERKTPIDQRSLPETESYLLGSLGSCYEIVGKFQEALSLYDSAVARFPRDPEHWISRGIMFIYTKDDPQGYADLEKSVQLGTTRCLPYLLLAQREFNRGQFVDSYRLARAASERNGGDELRSMAHQIIAMSLSMRDQDIEWVLENFKIAEKLDPQNVALAKNREIAIARAEKKHTTQAWQLDRPDKRGDIVSLARIGADVAQHQEQMLSLAS